MKKTVSLTLSLAVASAIALIGAPATWAIERNETILLYSDDGAWSVDYLQVDSQQRTVISGDLQGDMGTVVVATPDGPAYVKYAGLGAGDGLAAAVEVQANQVAVAWDPSLDATSVAVLLNGEKLDVLDSGSATAQVAPGEKLQVQVFVNDSTSTDRNAVQSLEFAQFSLVAPLSATMQATAVAATTLTLPSKTTYRQNTFIPDPYVNLVANGPCSPLSLYSYRFVGDNRSWSPNDGASHRTRMDVNIDWTAGPTVTTVRHVGTTIRQIDDVNGNWREDARQTASNANMKITLSSLSANSAALHLDQDVVNPFCNTLVTNGIASTSTVAIYRAGYVTGSLNYLAMPNYEIYYRQDSGAFTPLARLSLMSAECLIKGPTSAFCLQAIQF
ncbi:MAG: hypothetical protein RL672_149 [Actinomycetota bacterium]